MKTRLGLLGLIGTAILGSVVGASGVTTNLIPVADTTLMSESPNNNLGGGTTFTSGGQIIHSPHRTRALLRFDVAAIIPAGATINSASLVVTVKNANPDFAINSTFNLQRMTAAWGEGDNTDAGTGEPAAADEASWNDRLGLGTPWATAGGDFVGTATASQAISGLGNYTFGSAGMAADVQMWLNNPGTNFGWVLRSQAETTAGTIRRFASRGGDPSETPKLTIDYSVGGTPAAPPNLFSLARIGNSVRFSFNAQANRTYAVEFRDAISGGSWNVLTNIPSLPADATLHITNTITGAQRHFRARTP